MRGRYIYFLLFIVFCLLTGCATSRQRLKDKDRIPKREFRGAWIQTVFQGEYKDMSPSQMKTDFVRKLDFLQDCGINAIVFQVRPEADAFYLSELEPWSRFYTGTQGLAPEGNFDLMAFLIAECHKRNMEFHAWLNPYRAAASATLEFAESHIVNTYPGRFVRYNNQILFDPGQPQNRHFICDVVKDIVSRYDVDAIHMDDYFYPYPAAGVPFPDDKSFERYGKSKGYTEATRGDWRRENVNTLIKELKQTIQAAKPWVRFGISPFGIYRNKKSTPDGSGSETSGLQNYDDLYADVLCWVEQGWIDYNIPQLYWEIGHASADYVPLIKWWDAHAGDAHLYIGQDVARTMKSDHLAQKMEYARTYPHVGGNCFWPANEILWNNKGVADSLKQHYHRYPALIPAYTNMYDRSPEMVKNLKVEKQANGIMLNWNAASTSHYYVVYYFAKGEKVDLNNPKCIFEITQDAACFLPYRNKGKDSFRVVVTAVDRYHNESKGERIKLKL
ncbi:MULTISPECIES: family 10 glycosylhydrolase [unclassified Parabacteroides]|uniref:glycoside hydrolase family 10 protein n=1 Tax=unclassified Parabacteroides TaxID=2649774 RepID=UPI0024738E57|nr:MULTISPECIES: family 10 glycosylhydrolase [unclassified Parabacteroides]